MHENHNFKLVKQEYVEERQSYVFWYEHTPTKAQLLCIENDDENKVFGIGFRTPVKNNTGVPHILEHSVLNGSEKYPVKEPFVELIKGSLNTFLNAFTFPDKTVYPVASQNKEDFYNLIDVYLDAVFFPKISREIFEQEGWHYELENKDQDLTYKGVVYNEMRGAYSNPERELYDKAVQITFPDTSYAFDSGGDPSEIPTLTYEEFKDFHDTLYHPSNSYIYFYGDDRSEDRFAKLDEYLSRFKQTKVSSSVKKQAIFENPVRETFPLAVNEGDDLKGMTTTTWILGDATDLDLKMKMTLMCYSLIGTPASPLYKALTESGLGEEVFGGSPDLNGAMYDPLVQVFFGIGLKGVKPENLKKVEKLILDTLDEVVKNGLDKENVAATLNTLEFQLRENNSGDFPQGLSVYLDVLSSWLYGGDPIEAVKFEAKLDSLKQQLNQNPRFVEELIETYLIQNKHRATLILSPDPDFKKQSEQAVLDNLKRKKESLSEQEIEQIIDRTLYLKRFQERLDSQEDLAKMPVLKLSDIDKKVRTIPVRVEKREGVELVLHDIFTSGIVYLDLAFDLRVLPVEMLPMVALYQRALLEVGTQKSDFVSLSHKIGSKTGGVDTDYLVCLDEKNELVAKGFVHAKALVDQSQDLLEILREILVEVNFDQKERLRQIIIEEKAKFESSLAQSGHAHANNQLKAEWSKDGWVSEKISGFTYLYSLRQLAQNFDQMWEQILSDLNEMHGLLVSQNNLLVNLTADEADLPGLVESIGAFVPTLPQNLAEKRNWSITHARLNQGFLIPAQVNYVGLGLNFYDYGYEFSGSALAILNYMRTGYLWEKVRVQGGAYGAMNRFDRHSGNLNFLSYRDPNIVLTIENYRKAGEFLKNSDINSGEILKSVIGAIGTLDDHLLPQEKGFNSLIWYLKGTTDEMRQKIRDELLATNLLDFRKFGEHLQDATKANYVLKILGNQGDLEKAKGQIADLTLEKLY